MNALTDSPELNVIRPRIFEISLLNSLFSGNLDAETSWNLTASSARQSGLPVDPADAFARPCGYFAIKQQQSIRFAEPGAEIRNDLLKTSRKRGNHANPNQHKGRKR